MNKPERIPHVSRLGVHIAQATPRRMEVLNRDPMRPIFDDDDDREGMGAAAWAVAAFCAVCAAAGLAVLRWAGVV